MTPSHDRIRADVARLLEGHGIAPKRAIRAAVRLVRGLSLDQRNQSADRDKTLIIMRDRIAELLQDHGVAGNVAESAAGQIIDWLRNPAVCGGRTLTRQWWGFFVNGKQACSMEIDGELIKVERDPVKSLRGRELRAAAWAVLAPLSIARICHLASEIAAMVESDWATVYVPLGEDLDRQARDNAIHQAFAGLSSIERVTALGVSQSTGYEVYKRLEGQRQKRQQPELPGV